MIDFKFKLGAEVKDTLSGFTGTVTFRVQYLTGCNQYGLLAKQQAKDVLKEKPEERQFDEHRLTATGKVFTLPGEEDKKKSPGGPIVKIQKTGSLLK